MTHLPRIDDILTHNGRSYRVRGFEPMSIPGRRADLEDLETGERVHVRITDLHPGPGCAGSEPPPTAGSGGARPRS